MITFKNGSWSRLCMSSCLRAVEPEARIEVISQISQACQQRWEIREKRASTQELFQSWLLFSVRSVLGPGVFTFGGPLTGEVLGAWP